jgi:glycosyltransferase involved in cell wall biosynthesis
MKVLLIEPCYVNFGGYFRAFNIGKSLSENGIRVDLLVSSPEKFQLRIKKKKIRDNFYQYELPRIDLNPRVNFTGRVLRGLVGLFFGLFRRYDIHHVFVPTQFESNIPGFFLKLLGKKVIMDWDDYFGGSRLFDSHKLVKRYVDFCEIRAPKFFENMVVVSDILEKKACEHGAKKVTKIINGINPGQFQVRTKEEGIEKVGLDRDKKYLLTFGNIFSKARAILLFRIFYLICEKDPNVRLLINTDPHRIAEEQGISKEVDTECFKNIINVGYINQEEQGYYLGASEAAIFLQDDSLDERACFSIRFGSFLNGESAIIMNDVDSEIGSVLKKYECGIIEKDLDILADKTVAFLKDPDLKKKLKDNAILAKKELLWEKQIPKLIEFYKSIK